MKKPPIAPPVYRPQPLPKVLQTKRSLSNRSLPPVAPQIFRTQQKPRVLQEKPKIGQAQFVAQPKQAPAAPPVYRPGPLPRVLQTKRTEASKATSLTAGAKGPVPSTRQGTVQRVAKPNSFPRPSSTSPRQNVIQGDFWELTPGGAYVWHNESPTPEWYALGRKYKREQDWFAWSVYKRKDVILREPQFAINVLKNAFPGYQFVTGTIRYHSDVEWESNLKMLDEEVDIVDPTFSGYTQGSMFKPEKRVVTIHQDREKMDTLIHELVHVNSKRRDFALQIGTELNEGITEYLAQFAMKLAGFKPTGHYKNIVPTIKKMADLIGVHTLAKAYFTGDANMLDDALGRCKVSLAQICGLLGHKYERLAEVEALDLNFGPIIIEKS